MKLGKYRHYKGKDYEVLGVALHTETDEKLVVYKPLYDLVFKENFFVRPLNMFLENVVVDGKEQPRFKYLG